MKNFLFALSLALISASLSAQDSVFVHRHAVGLNLFSLAAFEYQHPSTYYPPGVFYRYTVGKNTYRLSANGAVQKGTADFVNHIPETDNQWTGKWWHSEILVGFQRSIKTNGKINWYWYADAGVRHDGFSGLETYGDSSISYTNQPLRRSSIAMGIAPGTGISMRIGKHILLSAEADVFLGAQHFKWVESERYEGMENWSFYGFPNILHQFGITYSW
jgi:hypothetical protein